jgi:Sulfotransferase family
VGPLGPVDPIESLIANLKRRKAALHPLRQPSSTGQGVSCACFRMTQKRNLAERLEQARLHFARLSFALLRPRQFYRWQQPRKGVTPNGYSFQPFDEHRCIFVHIPKCAGVSISQSLFGNLAGGHAALWMYQIIFSPKQFRDYFKFTIVRNPWDRLVSAFCFLKGGGFDEEDKRWAQEHLSAYPDFGTFLRKWLNSTTIRAHNHFRPQCDFIRIGRRQPKLDFIGRYENLEADYSYICERLKINQKLMRLNVTQSQKRAYQDYYAEDTRQKVAELYADDIRFLGYSFENNTSTRRTREAVTK